jgi:hypothetical protein
LRHFDTAKNSLLSDVVEVGAVVLVTTAASIVVVVAAFFVTGEVGAGTCGAGIEDNAGSSWFMATTCNFAHCPRGLPSALVAVANVSSVVAEAASVTGVDAGVVVVVVVVVVSHVGGSVMVVGGGGDGTVALSPTAAGTKVSGKGSPSLDKVDDDDESWIATLTVSVSL